MFAMFLKNIDRSFLFAKNIRPKQLLARIRLMLKRKALQKLATIYPAITKHRPKSEGILSEKLPQSILPSRFFIKSLKENSFKITFLNESRSFSVPFEWHLPELENGTRLWKLHLHYMEFLETVNDQEFQSIVGDWINQNYPYRKGYWLDNWNSFSLSIRCVVWMQQYEKRREHLGETFKKVFKDSLWQQIHFLEKNLEYDICGNHLLKNIKALIWAGRFFKGKISERWFKLGKRLLRAELQEQILSDGMHYERSPAYLCQIFADCLDCYSALEGDEFRREFAPMLAKIADAVSQTTHPDSKPSLFNDGGVDMAYSGKVCLDAYTQLIGKEVFQKRNICLSDAGYYGFRSNEFFILADCGDIAPDFLVAHGHGDILSFELSVGRQRVIVDPGVYEYNSSPMRDYGRSALSHNTVVINNIDQCDFWGSFRVGRRAHADLLKYEERSNGFYLEGTHDGYDYLEGSPKHYRSFDLNGKRIFIKDKFTGKRVSAVSGFLLAPSFHVRLSNNIAVIFNDTCEIVVKSDAYMSVTQAHYSPNFGVKENVKRLCFDYGAIDEEKYIEILIS